MKRLFFAFVFVLILTSCTPEEEVSLVYDETAFVFEINQEGLDLSLYFESENSLLINDSAIDFGTLGEYTLLVTDIVTSELYEIKVEIVDTLAPDIIIPDDFVQHYEVGSELDLSLIEIVDNSFEEISYTTNLHEINMNAIGTYSLIVIAQDSTGNLVTTSIEIYVRTMNLPMIEIRTSNISPTGFSVEFVEDDLDGYKVESNFTISIGDDVVEEGEITDIYTFNFTDLLQNTDYTVDMEFIYKIPGEEREVMTSRVLVTTSELFEPIVQVDNEIVTSDSISFDVSVIDPDNLIDGVEVFVFDQDNTEIMFVVVEDSKTITLTELNFGQTYTVVIDYPYDFADGNGEQMHSDTYTYQCEDKTVPDVTAEVTSISGNNVNIEVVVEDLDYTIISLTIKIYQNSTLIEDINAYQASESYMHTHSAFLSYDEDYQIVVEVTYAVIEGEIVEEDVLNIGITTETQN